MNKKKDSENHAYYMPIGMCLGISIGTVIGVATDNMPIFMTTGMSIGLCIGALIDAQNRKKNSDSSQEDKKDS